MGDAKRRGTYADRKAAPLGLRSNHDAREIKRARKELQAKPRPVKAVRE